jgi:glycosidase
MRTSLAILLLASLLLSCKNKDDQTSDTATVDPDVIAATGPTRDCDITLSFDAASAASVEVGGRFNEWEPWALVDADGDGTWELSLGELVTGVYGHKFIIDGIWEDSVPADVFTTWDDGFENRALYVGDCDLPLLDAVSAEATADGTLSATLQFTRAVDRALLDAASVRATVGGVDVDCDVDTSAGTLSLSMTGLSDGKHSVRVEVLDTEGRAPEGGAVMIPLWVEAEPFDWARGSMYFVFTDRFRDGGDDGHGTNAGTIDGTDWMGGDLVGAKAALDEGWFDDLGVTSIWLSPVYDNPEGSYGGSFGYLYTGYHGYWPISGRDVEQRWGANGVSGEDALRDFIDTAHEHGIRVILDTVMNHVHQDHTWVTDHPDWFGAPPCPCTSDAGPCNWDTNPLGCWFTDYLPDLDYQNRHIVSEVLADMEFWVEEYDVDGFRVDAAKHMDHVILRSTRLRLSQLFEQPSGVEMYLVGETFTGQGGQGLINDYIAPYELSGQFDFPLLYPIRSVGQGGSFRDLAGEVAAGDEIYGDAVHRMSVFQGNHDVARYATDIQGCDGYDPYTTLFDWCPDTMLDGDSSSIAGDEWAIINPMALGFAFVLTQPGPPLIYYGDELGLAGAGDPDNRRLMPWDNRSMAQQTLLERVQSLGKARLTHTALQVGERRELWVDDTLYVYARDAGGGDVAIVALHNGGSTRVQEVPIPTDLSLEGLAFTDTLAGNRSGTVGGGSLQITLDPYEYVVLTRD